MVDQSPGRAAGLCLGIFQVKLQAAESIRPGKEMQTRGPFGSFRHT
jgi:hypothetical protein